VPSEGAVGELLPARLIADGCAIHHVDAGPRDGETVVLIHGITATHRYWRANVQALARRRRVIALELPGFGRSDKPAAPYTTPWFVSMLAAFLDGKGIARPHLVGNSMGGQIAMLFALTHPRRVDRLVLVDPAGATAWPRRLFDLALGGAELALRGGRVPPTPTFALAALFHLVFPGRPDLARRYTRSYAAVTSTAEFPHYLRAGVRAARGVLATPLLSRARELGAPTLIMWGARDHLLPVTAARPLRRRIPHARLLIYRESGHCPMVDQPERWNRDVELFLDGNLVGR
jgi:pimeloyl-ACP methyl ester carboxylesterase